MKKIFFTCLCLFLLAACGVKAPPIAPVRKPNYTGPEICSVYDDQCPLTDAGYMPKYDPYDPKAVSKVLELQRHMEAKRAANQKGQDYTPAFEREYFKEKAERERRAKLKQQSEEGSEE